MSVMNNLRNAIPLTKVMMANPQMLKVQPSLLWFMAQYMNKFGLKDVGGNLILHSHLPPLNSHAYTRFVDEHLIARVPGPSHAQIGLTNVCPQNCGYCYNKTRKGKAMDKETIKRTARDLVKMGVVWLGLTGGEPLLNEDIVEIVRSVSDDCAVKLFTTGCGLTAKLASDLRDAGLFSVSISLDHWTAENHDQGRGYPGAFRSALDAIEILKSTSGLHVSVSAVLTRDMIKNHETERFLAFLKGLGVHEAWLSEAKPSVKPLWDSDEVISEKDRLGLVRLQDQYNSGSGMTVNYLGHFEGKECFGCNAGRKMVYVDAFGEVSPCVFTPMTFGNVQVSPIEAIFRAMSCRFPSDGSCFVNKNYHLLAKYSNGVDMIGKEDTLRMLDEVHFGAPPKFFKIYSRGD